MRYAFLSDIHSNLAAFEAVLRDIDGRGGVDRIWCLGDVVGYGPRPQECLRLLRQHDHLCVAGNHDWGAIGKLELEDFNPDAAAACRWTGQQLGTAQTQYLADLPLVLVEGDFTLVHGSPRAPLWEYLLSSNIARVSFGLFQTQFCLVGHSHVPLIFAEGERVTLQAMEAEMKLGEERLIINPGSVGQPRDGDPRASYALYSSDDRTLWHYRVAYDIPVTQREIMERGLPRRLATRLSHGW